MSHFNPITVLGEMPIGNPEDMRTRARTMRVLADDLSSYANQVVSRARAVTFLGPAADRWRSAEEARHVDAIRRSSQLHDLADYLVAAAARVETAQHSWKAAAIRLEQAADRAIHGKH